MTSKSKELFNERDLARERAKISDSDEDWSMYKNLKNKSIKALRKDKKKYHEDLYLRMEMQNYTKGMFKTTRKTTGLDRKIDLPSSWWCRVETSLRPS